MKRYVGIWVDRKKAVRVVYDQSEAPDAPEMEAKIKEFASGVEKRIRTSGGSRTGKVPWGPQQTASESKSQARHQHQLKAFYQRLVKALGKADRILIMGPGETKQGLMRAISKDPATRDIPANVETCDKLSANQVAARVREFYQL